MNGFDFKGKEGAEESVVDFGIDLYDEVIEIDGLVIFLLAGSKEDFEGVMDGISTISAS